MKQSLVLVMSLALSGWIAGAAADPLYKDNGKSRYRGNETRHGGFELHSGRRGYPDWASIPQAQLPPPGKCRAWFLSRLPSC
jgi:hypothetical protein